MERRIFFTGSARALKGPEKQLEIKIHTKNRPPPSVRGTRVQVNNFSPVLGGSRKITPKRVCHQVVQKAYRTGRVGSGVTFPLFFSRVSFFCCCEDVYDDDVKK